MFGEWCRLEQISREILIRLSNSPSMATLTQTPLIGPLSSQGGVKDLCKFNSLTGSLSPCGTISQPSVNKMWPDCSMIQYWIDFSHKNKSEDYSKGGPCTEAWLRYQPERILERLKKVLLHIMQIFSGDLCVRNITISTLELQNPHKRFCYFNLWQVSLIDPIIDPNYVLFFARRLMWN